MIKIAGKHKQYISIGTYTVGLSLIFCSCQVYVISWWGIKLLGYSAVWFVWSQACILGWHCLLAYFSSNSYSFKYFFSSKRYFKYQIFTTVNISGSVGMKFLSSSKNWSVLKLWVNKPPTCNDNICYNSNWSSYPKVISPEVMLPKTELCCPNF